MTGRKLFLTGWLIAPIVIVAGLCTWIIVSMRQPPKMDAPPVGAGAGHTGGANALGEWLAHKDRDGSVRIVLADHSAQPTPEHPPLLATRGNGWKGAAMAPEGPARWVWTGPIQDLDEGFEILWVASDGSIYRDPFGRHVLRVSAGEQIVDLDEWTR